MTDDLNSLSPSTTISGPAQPTLLAEPAPAARTGLVVEGITKTFGATIALNDVSATFASGTVHGLIGENGSGKSTLSKIVTGTLRAESGRISYGGDEIVGGRARSSNVRVACVFQDGSLIEELTVQQNLDLIVDPVFRGVNSGWARELLDRFGLKNVSTGSKVGDIKASERRMVEIAAMHARKPDVMLFDEATSSLDEVEVDRVLNGMREAAASGTCVIFVTHRLHEVRAVATHIVVLRDGSAVGEFSEETSTEQLVSSMAGREVAAFTKGNRAAVSTKIAITAQALTTDACGPIEFTGKRGEVIGVGGAAGNGQAELIRALGGEAITSGRVMVGDKKISGEAHAPHSGVVFVSSHRATESLSSMLSIRENYTIGTKAAVGHWWKRIPRRAEVQETGELADQFALVRGSLEQPVSSLSGGNQQKVAIGRAIARKPDVLLIEEPTEGVDVRSRYDIYRAITEVADAGMCVIFTSSDASELRLLADRVILLANGEIVSEQAGDVVTEESIVQGFTAAVRVQRKTKEEGEAKRAARAWSNFSRFTFAPGAMGLLVVLLLALGAIASAVSPDFATPGNIAGILQAAEPLAVVAIAQVIVLLVGEIDASLGSMMGLIVVILSFFPDAPIPVLLLIALGSGLLMGLLNALLVIVLKINSVIATIATLGVFLGLGEILRPTPGGLISVNLTTSLAATLGPIPIVFFVIIVLVIVVDVIVNASRTGLRSRAVGYSNIRANQLGVASTGFRFTAFLVAGLIAGFAGILLAAQVGVGDPSVGQGYTLLSIAIPVIGGALLTGGRGSALGCLIAAAFVAEMEVFVPFVGVPTGGYQIAVGILTLIVLIISVVRFGSLRSRFRRRSIG